MSNNSKRWLTAIVALALVLPVLIAGGLKGVQILCVAAVIIGADEFARMSNGEERWDIRAVQVIVSFCVALALLLEHYPHSSIIPLFIRRQGFLLALFVLPIVTIMFSFSAETKNHNRELMITNMISGVIYITLPIMSLALLRGMHNGFVWMFFALAMTWLTDAGAYIVGRRFGKRKMAPEISPKKTYEGLAGGIAASLIIAIVFKVFWMNHITWFQMVIMAPTLTCAAVYGDLAMSVFKRAYKADDTGWILPGHGGLLDRIDALLFTAPLTYLFAVIF